MRYKNRYITAADAVDLVTALILENIEEIKNLFLRISGTMARRFSYRLGTAHRTYCKHYLTSKLGPQVTELLARYDNGSVDFSTAKNCLMGLMNRLGAVRYKRPSFLNTPANNSA